MKKGRWIVLLLCCSLLVSGCEKWGRDDYKKENREKPDKKNTEASTTPFGRYEDTVFYTLGKMTGANNSNLPDGENYEDNAYTRYLKKKLNIQNKNIFEVAENQNFL